MLNLFRNDSVQVNKKIYVYENSLKYLADFAEDFPVCYGLIEGIIEPNVRYRTGTIPIYGTEIIESIDWDDALLLIMSDYYEEAYDRIRKAHNVPDTIFYYLNYESETEINEKYKRIHVPLKKSILFRSGPHESQYVKGMDFADNSRALFEYMLSAGVNNEYELIWMVKNPADYKVWEEKNNNVRFISFDVKNEEYYDVLFLSKFILFTDAYGFARNCRKEQVRIQLWHGCGFKTRTNFVSCERRYEYNIVISELYKKIHAEIYGLRDNQVVITGYPKADLLNRRVKPEKLKSLGIPQADKYIFWLPTFRKAKERFSELNEKSFEGETGLPIVSSMEEMQRINDILQENNSVLIIKLHPFQDEEIIHIRSLSNIVLLKNEELVNADIQINELLSKADALISDYSSVAVEYLILDRPIGFCLDDVEEYEQSRGFVFDNIKDYLPGQQIYNFEEFMIFIEDSIKGVDRASEKRKRIAEEMHEYLDFESSKRVTDWMMSLNAQKL